MQFERTRMYRVKEVADHFGVHPATIYRAIEAGELVALRLGTRAGALRVPGGAVESYAKACAHAANHDADPADTTSTTTDGAR